MSVNVPELVVNVSVLVVDLTCNTAPVPSFVVAIAALLAILALVTADDANCDVPTEPALGVCKVIPLSAIIKSMLSDEVKALAKVSVEPDTV